MSSKRPQNQGSAGPSTPGHSSASFEGQSDFVLHDSRSVSGTTTRSAKTVKGSNLGVATTVLDRFRALRGAVVPQPTSPKANAYQENDRDKNKTPSSFLKRWSQRKSSTVKPVGEAQHQVHKTVLDSSRTQSVAQQNDSELTEGKQTVQFDRDVSDFQPLDDDDESQEFVFPESPELLEFPPPPPGAHYNKLGAGNRKDKWEKSLKGKDAEGREPGHTFPKRTRSMLNERTFATIPRYSSPSPSSPYRPPSRSSNDKPSLSPPPIGSSSFVINKPRSLYSLPPASTSSTTKRRGFSRLSNPLPLPPGWTFQPDSTIPVRKPELQLPSTPSCHESLRASRSRSLNGSTTHSRRHHLRRPPSPRPTSLRPSDDQRSKHSHSPRSLSWSSSSPVRKAKDPRIASFTSLESIIGGNSSESDVASDASSSSVSIDVVVEPRSNKSQLSLASWPYFPSPPPSSSDLQAGQGPSLHSDG